MTPITMQRCIGCGVATDRLEHIGALEVYCCGADKCYRELRGEQQRQIDEKKFDAEGE